MKYQIIAKGATYYVTLAMVIFSRMKIILFSRVKISCFHAKDHLTWHFIYRYFPSESALVGLLKEQRVV